MVALSVSISASSSPRRTSSPSALSQRRIVPSSMESDSRGMVTSTPNRLDRGDRDAPAGGGGGPREEEALAGVAAQLLQHRQLGGRLHPLGHAAHAERVPQRDDR